MTNSESIGVRTRVRFAQIPDWIITDPRISHGAMRLYALLARYANGDAEAWPKRRTLASQMPGRSSGDLGVSLTSIDKWLSELVDAGALTRDLRFRDNGMQTSSLYTVEMMPPTPSPLSGEGGSPLSGEGGSPLSGEGGSPLSGEGGSPLSGEGKNESQVNESQEKKTSPRTADADGTATPITDDSPGCITCGEPRADGHHHRETPDTTTSTSMPAHDHPASRPRRNSWKRVAEARPDITELLGHLAESVEACTSTRPRDSKRAFDAMRLLVDTDGRTPEQVRAAIDWARGNQFWSGVILGAESLRKNYVKMQAQAAREQHMPPRRPASDRGAEILRAEMSRAVELDARDARDAATSETTQPSPTLPMLDMMRDLPRRDR